MNLFKIKPKNDRPKFKFTWGKKTLLWLIIIAVVTYFLGWDAQKFGRHFLTIIIFLGVFFYQLEKTREENEKKEG